MANPTPGAEMRSRHPTPASRADVGMPSAADAGPHLLHTQLLQRAHKVAQDGIKVAVAQALQCSRVQGASVGWC